MPTIAVDAMGGDHAPAEMVKGALRAAKVVRSEILLVGDKDRLQQHLPRRFLPRNLQVIHCSDVIGMEESPGPGLRRRDQASMVVAARLVNEGKAQAMVSAGNTGALHQIALLEIGRLKGVRRPALAALLPTERQPALALDLGANADSKPEYLLQFAYMGSTYASQVLEVVNPRIGLLNIGTEPSKGNHLVVAARELIEASSGLNFIGNIEPTGFFQGQADVVVCDGFVGNMMLKTAEAVSEFIMKRMRQAATSNARAKVGGALLRPSLRSLKQDISHTDHGGAMLLGLKGMVIKCHGRADSEALANGIRVAEQALARHVLASIAQSVSSVGSQA